MNKLILNVSILLIFVSCTKNKAVESNENKAVSETFFNKEIKDPYWYLEDIKDSSVINWLKEQEKKSKEIIDKIKGRQALLEQINTFEDSKPFTITKLRITDNNYYFYLKKKPTDVVAKLFYRKGFAGKEIELYNPLNFKPDTHKKYLINYIKPSWDASKIVISLTEGGKEISEMVILDVKSKKLYPEVIDHCWPSALGNVKWLPDNARFIYTYIPDLDKSSKNYILNTSSVIHRIGTDPKQFKVLFSKKNNPTINIKEEDFPEVTIANPNDSYIFSYVLGATNYFDSYYSPITNIDSRKIKWNPLFKKEDKIKTFFILKNTIVYLTSKNASNFKICKTSLKNPNFKNPITLVAEDSTAVITDLAMTNKGLFYVKTKNGVEAKLFWLHNKTNQEIKLPKPAGHINVSSKGYQYDDLWISIRGWTTKDSRYRYDYKNNRFEEENLAPVQYYPELDNVIIKEIEVPSYDGVMVPLSIIYKKGTKKNKNNRVLINAYGAYKWSNAPNLHPYLLNWVRSGGLYAVAHVRGGGEKGDAWHKAGFKTTKPNTWKDLIACTEYLIDENYTNPNKMATWGASAGGICIGRAITERPDLYAVAIIQAGLLNPLRLEFAPNGKNNSKEFGTIKDAIEFEALYEMDAYHHIKKEVKYPAIYLTAGMNDPRLTPWQPAKFAARIQNATTSKKPILFSVDFAGGHGFDVNQNKKNKNLVDIFSFALWQTGHPDFQPQ